jgi:hypothetical protein
VRALPWLLIVAALGCSPREPPSWPQGGAPLALAPARWDRGDDDPVEITADGRVLEDGDLLFVLDRVGRVVNEDYEPMAILLPDGRVFGVDDRPLGHVGVTNAAPPWAETAWVAVMPDGNAIHFTSEGDRESLGRWQGCSGAVQRSCTLVTHLFALRKYPAPSQSGVSVGVGIGVGF